LSTLSACPTSKVIGGGCSECESAAEPGAEADRGRHVGSVRHESCAGGPGSLALAIVAGQPAEEADLLGTGGIPGAVALSNGRPVLVIPPAGARSLVADRIIVAWNESREATRAIGDAMPFLQKASRVGLLTIGGDGGEPDTGESSVQKAARHLARHGVSAEANALPQSAAEAAEFFMARANRYGADLVVMGAYGRSRLQEFVLGGMTRQLLNYSPVPLFLSH